MCVTVRNSGFVLLCFWHFIVFLTCVYVGGSSDCKIVLLFVYVGG